MVKDLGTNFEQALPDKVRLLAPPPGDAQPDGNDDRFEEALRYTTLIAPKLTIQGGTREVLRGIIARGLGLAVRCEDRRAPSPPACGESVEDERMVCSAGSAI